MSPEPTIPLWLPDPQSYAIQQERYRHDGALSYLGEYALFVLLWNIQDHEAGDIGRCPDCYLSQGRMAEVYNQAPRKDCLTCFGTTFGPQPKAKIVRLSLWDMTEESNKEGRRGETHTKTATVQSESDFRVRVGDYILRGDNTRWQIQNTTTNHLRTGFLMPDKVDTSLGYVYSQAVQEDESSVAYLIPPEDLGFLDLDDPHHPPEWTEFEEINGSLT